MSNLLNKVEELLLEIRELEGTDAFAMANCDPNDQFLIGEEIRESTPKSKI